MDVGQDGARDYATVGTPFACVETTPPWARRRVRGVVVVVYNSTYKFKFKFIKFQLHLQVQEIEIEFKFKCQLAFLIRVRSSGSWGACCGT